MIGIIYEHKNKINNKRYVGQTVQQLKARIREGYFNTKFANALNKYGWKNFETTVLFEIEEQDKTTLIDKLNVIEEIIIMRDNLQDDEFGYNVKAGGSNGSFCHTKEAIEKIREASRRPNSGHFKKNSTPWIKGKSIKPTEEHKLKVSIGLKKSYSNGHRLSWNKGKIMDEETRKKISIANIGKPKGKFPTHCRWHVNRGIFNKNCEYCIGSIKKCRES